MKKVQKTVSIIALAILSAGVISCGDKNSSTLQEITSSFKSDVDVSGLVTYDGNRADVGAKVILTTYKIDADLWKYTVLMQKMSLTNYSLAFDEQGSKQLVEELKQVMNRLQKRFNVSEDDEQILYIIDKKLNEELSSIESSSSSTVAVANSDGNYSMKVKPGKYYLIAISNNKQSSSMIQQAMMLENAFSTEGNQSFTRNQIQVETVEISENGLQKLIKF